MSRNKDSMTPKRWAYIKQLGVRDWSGRVRGHYIHISAFARMVNNPVDPMLPMLPYIERPGMTLVLRSKARGDHETNVARTA